MACVSMPTREIPGGEQLAPSSSCASRSARPRRSPQDRRVLDLAGEMAHGAARVLGARSGPGRRTAGAAPSPAPSHDGRRSPSSACWPSTTPPDAGSTLEPDAIPVPRPQRRRVREARRLPPGQARRASAPRAPTDSAMHAPRPSSASTVAAALERAGQTSTVQVQGTRRIALGAAARRCRTSRAGSSWCRPSRRSVEDRATDPRSAARARRIGIAADHAHEPRAIGARLSRRLT